jgi:hypothetical protein
MLRVLAVLLALCGTAHSEEGGPGESKGKAEAAQKSNQKGETAQQPPVPTGLAAPPIINIYTAKHAGEESHCTKPKDWKEWGSLFGVAASNGLMRSASSPFGPSFWASRLAFWVLRLGDCGAPLTGS